MIFQPAEEGLAGAKAILDDGRFSRESVTDYTTIPESHWEAMMRLYVMPTALDYFVLRIVGKRSHIAQPHRGIDPIIAAGHALVALQSIVNRRVDPLQSAVINIGQTQRHA